jgi:RimJ/RimL family protein N-acetyltransferase
MKVAMECSRDAFAAVIETDLPSGWPEFPEAFASDGPASASPWTGYLFVRSDDEALVGNGGFVSAPDAAGAVEIGYEIAPDYRNMGFATAAVRLLLETAFANGARSVVAHTRATPDASGAVLRKAGLRQVAELPDPELGGIWRWQIDAMPAQGETAVNPP